jgi:hypothetical protein
LSASTQAGLSSSNPRIINLYFAPQRLACQVDQRPGIYAASSTRFHTVVEQAGAAKVGLRRRACR